MEVLFENHYTRTPEILRELYQHLYFKRPVSIAIYVAFALAIIAAVIFGGIFVNSLIYFVIILVMQFFLYRKAVKMSIKRDESKFDTAQLYVQTRMSEEELHCRYGESTTRTVSVADIKGGWQTKNLIVLRTNIKLVIIIHKRNFTVGDCEGFVEFLRGKGIKV